MEAMTRTETQDMRGLEGDMIECESPALLMRVLPKHPDGGHL